MCYAKATLDKFNRRDAFNGFAIDISETIRAEYQLRKANEKLKMLSVLDGLSRITNRRKFDEYLDQEWNRHLRSKKCLSIILCDIVFFKFYNDTYGHQAGDECLKKVVTAISSCVHRSINHAARYGGEEFAVILPEWILPVQWRWQNSSEPPFRTLPFAMKNQQLIEMLH
jgi:diguanylate cyclase (GGDEF)-like protein